MAVQARTKKLWRRAGVEEARGSFQVMSPYQIECAGMGNLLRCEKGEQLVSDACARLPLGQPRENPELFCGAVSSVVLSAKDLPFRAVCSKPVTRDVRNE